MDTSGQKLNRIRVLDWHSDQLNHIMITQGKTETGLSGSSPLSRQEQLPKVVFERELSSRCILDSIDKVNAIKNPGDQPVVA